MTDLLFNHLTIFFNYMNPMKKRNPFNQTILILLCVALLASCSTMVDEGVSELPDSGLELRMEKALDLMTESTPQSISLCEDVIKDAENMGLTHTAGKAKWYLGYIYDEIDQNVSKAYFYYNESIRDLKQTNDYSTLHSVYLNLGELNRVNGQVNNAVALYEEALKFEKEFSKEELADLYYNYGIVLKLQGTQDSFNKAQKAIEASLSFAREIQNQEDIARVNNQIGLMYKDIGNYEMARIAYQNTIREFQHHPNLKEFAGLAYHGIGVTFMEEEKWDQSIESFKQALEYKTNSRSIFVTMYDMGTVQMKAGYTEEAILAWKEAVKEDYNQNNLEHVKIFSNLTKALSAKDRNEEALVFAEIYNDNIENILDNTEVASMDQQTVLFKDVVREYDDFVQKEPALDYQQIILMTLAIVLLSLSLFSTYKYLRKRKEAKAFRKLQATFEQFKVD